MPPLSALPAAPTEPVQIQRALLIVLAVYLALVWFCGGPTVDVTALDEWLMLLALLPLSLAAPALLARVPQARLVRMALLVAVLLPAIPLLQLMAVPETVWRWSPARAQISSELLAAGITVGPQAWSLWPETTARSLYALLPALACFMGALALVDAQRRRLVPMVLGLLLANLAFGFFQVGLPPNSSMRLYTDNGAGIGGVLVNGNHQGTALVIGMLLGLGLWARERQRQRHSGQPPGLKAAAYATAAFSCFAAVPLTGSSGAMVIAIVALGVAVIATGLLPIRRILRSRAGMAAGIGVVAVLVVGLLSAQRWMNLKDTDAMRYQLASEVTTLGAQHAPLGSGAGTFVDSFVQSASSMFERGEYVNHAHNEFAQWWFEAGWPGVVVLVFALGLLAVSGWRLLRERRSDPVAIACWLAVLAVLAHSSVDFPLRTLSLMSITGFLCGVVVAAVNARDPQTRAAEGTDVAPQRA